MKPKTAASVIIAKRTKDGKETDAAPEGEHSPELMHTSEGLISAVHAKDATAVAGHLKAAHQHLSAKDAKDEHKE